MSDDAVAVDVSSPTNPRVKDVVRLRARRTRDTSGRTLIEGHDELALALRCGTRPAEIFWAPALVGAGPNALVAEAQRHGIAVTSVSRAAFEKMSYRQSPDGWLAVATTPGVALSELPRSDNPLVLVGEGIEKPGNLGAMIRTAEAFGVDAVVSAAPVTDFGNPNTVRASKGSVFAVPVAAAPSRAVLDWLRERAVAVVVTTPDGEVALDQVDLTGPTAVVVGAESTGVTALWLEHADATVAIPMRGQVNSLNAAAAAALALYEATRQRRGPQR